MIPIKVEIGSLDSVVEDDKWVIHFAHPIYLPLNDLHMMTLQLEDVRSLLAPFGDVLRVRESDAYLLGSGPKECLEILLRVRRGIKITNLMTTLGARGYSVEMVRLKGRRLKFVLIKG